jgi:hypothetical protein
MHNFLLHQFKICAYNYLEEIFANFCIITHEIPKLLISFLNNIATCFFYVRNNTMHPHCQCEVSAGCLLTHFTHVSRQRQIKTATIWLSNWRSFLCYSLQVLYI